MDVTVDHGTTETFHLTWDDGKVKLETVEEGMQQKEFEVNNVRGAMSSLNLSGVAPAGSDATLRATFEHPETADPRHWTARKFHGYLNQTVGLEVGYSTVVRWLHEQGFRLKVPQPWPDRQDEELR